MRRIATVAIILLLLSAASASGLWQQYQLFLRSPLAIGADGILLPVKRGYSMNTVVSDLELHGATRMDWRWRLLNKLQPVTIKAGEYTLDAGITPEALLRLLVSGKVVSYRFTIVEGWNIYQLLAALGKDQILQHTLYNTGDMESVNGLPAGHSEGWFLPETYVFVRGDSDLKILQRAYRDMQHGLLKAWAGRDTGLPYETAYEMLIMASIIEKETSLDEERATIAGVFVRRLLKKWRLETDPTVIYGLGESYDGNIRRRDLDTDTPYNTYTRHGLPPTPIALPGQASLQAAAHPGPGEAMFFVADGQGGHTFSATLEEHNRAVRQMLKRKSGQRSTKE